MNDVSPALEMTFMEIIVENGFHAKLIGRRSHTENTRLLFYNNNILILIDNLNVLVDQFGATFVTCNANNLANIKHMIVLCYQFAVNSYGMSCQQILGAVSADT